MHGLTSQPSKWAFSRDGRRLAVLVDDWQLGVWDIEHGRLEWMIEVPAAISADNAALAFSADGQQLAVAVSQAAQLWDLQAGRLLRSWPLPKGLQQWLAFDREGRLLLSQWDLAGDRTTAVCRVRDLVRGTNVLTEIPPWAGTMDDGAMSPEGRIVVIAYKRPGASGREVYALKAYDSITSKPVPLPPIHGRTGHLRFDPTGSIMANRFDGARGTVLYRLPAGEELMRMDELMLSIGPKGELFVVNDQVLRKVGQAGWSLDLKPTPEGLGSAFSYDGQRLAVGLPDGSILVYDIQETIQHLEQLRMGW